MIPVPGRRAACIYINLMPKPAWPLDSTVCDHDPFLVDISILSIRLNVDLIIQLCIYIYIIFFLNTFIKTVTQTFSGTFNVCPLHEQSVLHKIKTSN